VKRPALIACVALGLAVGALSVPFAAAAETPAAAPRVVYAPGKLVPVPASIPHEAGDMVDSRIVGDLLWISERYPIYVTDGYSGPLPGGGWAGCRGCHTRGSDHYHGLGVDIVPADPSSRCDAKWAALTRLALWAEPRPGKPALPFRWVGYDGDAGHGCGHHLHLSWNHAVAKRYQLPKWVEVFAPAGGEPTSRKPRRKKIKRVSKAPAGPSGGIAQVSTGGIGAGD
jgi:hypothetical protein